MTLDHESGDLYGTVLKGRFRGKLLDEMAIEDLVTLLADCRVEDAESAAVLETYLDRRFNESWREQFHQEQTHGDSSGSSSGGADINIEEAYDILGVPQSASLDEIRSAHKRLIQKVHPDRGGSPYLAAKINKAKDIIMTHLKNNGNP